MRDRIRTDDQIRDLRLGRNQAQGETNAASKWLHLLRAHRSPRRAATTLFL